LCCNYNGGERVGRKGQGDKGDKETRDRRILYPSQPSDIDEMVEIPAGEFEGE